MKVYNNVDMKGRLYNYALKEIDLDTSNAISGTITLQVDEEGTTVEVRVFAKPEYNSGKKNPNFGLLNDMLAGNYRTVVDDGDEADWLAANGKIDISYFVIEGQQEVSRAQKISAPFINLNKKHEYTNKWKLDYLLTKVNDIEADPEKGYDRFLRTDGYLVDDYNKRLMEVKFDVRKEAAINYIAGLEPTIDAPYYVNTWGRIVQSKRIIVRKNAFGEDTTDEYNSTSWVIEGMSPDPYDFESDDQDTFKDYLNALEEHKESRAEKEKEEETF